MVLLLALYQMVGIFKYLIETNIVVFLHKSIDYDLEIISHVHAHLF
jgi:hypothetical protein